MIWAGCFAALLALALVGHIRMSVRGEYTKTSVGLWLCVGRIQYRLYPKGKKKSDVKPKPPARTPKRAQKEKPFLTPHGMFQLGKRLFPIIWEGADAFRHKLRVDRLWLNVLVGGPDPADAALQYGQIYTLFGTLWQPVTEAFHVQNGRVQIEMDFDRKTPALYGVVSLSITISQVLWLGARFGPKLIKVFLKVRREDRHAQMNVRKAA